VGNNRLLIIANDLYHEFGHRIRELKRYIEQQFDVDAISLVPPGYVGAETKRHEKRFLRGWPEQVIHRRKPLFWKQGHDTLIRRAPLPSICGPYVNLLMLRRMLRSINLSSYVGILAQGPVPGKAIADSGRLFCYDHADNYWGGRVDRIHRMILGRWQDSAIRHASAVSCAGESLNNHARRLHNPKTAVFSNGVHLADYIQSRSEQKEPTLVYVGGLERDCGLVNTVKALALLSRPVRLVIAGSGPLERTLKRHVASISMESVVDWRGPINRSQVSTLLSTSWIGLALFGDTLWNRHAFHLKIVEYMAAGLPFLATPVGDAGILARSTGAGIVVADDPVSIARSLEDLIEDARLRIDMGNRGRIAARSYAWSEIGTAYTAWIAAAFREG